MYQNIGLPTPRGSGTSGYVQRNLGFLRPARNDLKTTPSFFKKTSEPPKIRKPNDEILEHQRKREIERKLLEMREWMIEQGVDEKVILDRVAQKRLQLNQERPSTSTLAVEKMDTHQVAQLKEQELEKFRSAFKIGSDHKVGAAFDAEAQEQRRLEKLEEQKQRKEKDREIAIDTLKIDKQIRKAERSAKKEKKAEKIRKREKEKKRERKEKEKKRERKERKERKELKERRERREKRDH